MRLTHATQCMQFVKLHQQQAFAHASQLVEWSHITREIDAAVSVFCSKHSSVYTDVQANGIKVRLTSYCKAFISRHRAQLTIQAEQEKRKQEKRKQEVEVAQSLYESCDAKTLLACLELDRRGMSYKDWEKLGRHPDKEPVLKHLCQAQPEVVQQFLQHRDLKEKQKNLDRRVSRGRSQNTANGKATKRVQVRGRSPNKAVFPKTPRPSPNPKSILKRASSSTSSRASSATSRTSSNRSAGKGKGKGKGKSKSSKGKGKGRGKRGI